MADPAADDPLGPAPAGGRHRRTRPSATTSVAAPARTAATDTARDGRPNAHPCAWHGRPGRHRTIDRQGFIETLDRATTERHEAGVADAPGQRPNRVGDDHLAGAGHGTQPRGHVDGRTDWSFRRVERLAGVDPDTDVDRVLRVDDLVARAPDDVEGTGDRDAGRREDDVEAVALRPDLTALVGRDRAADDAPKPLEEVGRGRRAAMVEVRRVAA